MTVLSNDHLLVTMLIDVCTANGAPTLAEALTRGKPPHLFMSTEMLDPCPEVYDEPRVRHGVHLEFDYGKMVTMAYHTSHIVSDTGRMTLAEGYVKGHVEAMIGYLHDRGCIFEIEPIVIGAPCLAHQYNGNADELMWYGYDWGEVLPEDIAEFARMKHVVAESAEEWMSAMRSVPEVHVKRSIASLLREPVKADWGGEENDHYSANASLGGRRQTAAFLLKGPAKFQEMTPAMCGKNGDQIYRLVNAGADISVIQHAHLIGPAVRETIRRMVVTPGRSRKYCVMDGLATYRLLKAYNLMPKSERRSPR